MSEIACREGIFDFVCSSVNGYVIVLYSSILVLNLSLPISFLRLITEGFRSGVIITSQTIGAEPIGETSFEFLAFRIGITDFHHSFNIFVPLHQIESAPYILDTAVTVKGNFDLAFRAALGGDDYDSVRSTGTVDSRRRGVLEYFH